MNGLVLLPLMTRSMYVSEYFLPEPSYIDIYLLILALSAAFKSSHFDILKLFFPRHSHSMDDDNVERVHSNKMQQEEHFVLKILFASFVLSPLKKQVM